MNSEILIEKKVPTYSVVIPHYRDTVRLNRLLISCPTDRHDVEIIVIDDCSPEQVELESLRVRWPRVLWLSTDCNSGAGVARNVGLDNVTGRWVVFADSDDEFTTDAFNIFDGVLRSDDQLVYFLAQGVRDGDGGTSTRHAIYNDLVRTYVKYPNKINLDNLRLGHETPVPKVYSRKFLDSYGFRFDSVRVANDVAFNVLAAMHASRIRAEEVTVYRVYSHASSLTSDIKGEAFLQRFLVTRSVAQRLLAIGHKRVIPATGAMVQSVFYGPRLAMKIWWLALHSPMRIDLKRIFDSKRWKRFASYRVKKSS